MTEIKLTLYNFYQGILDTISVYMTVKILYIEHDIHKSKIAFWKKRCNYYVIWSIQRLRYQKQTVIRRTKHHLQCHPHHILVKLRQVPPLGPRILKNLREGTHRNVKIKVKSDYLYSTTVDTCMNVNVHVKTYTKFENNIFKGQLNIDKVNGGKIFIGIYIWINQKLSTSFCHQVKYQISTTIVE